MPAFSNQATLSYNTGTVSSNIVTGEVVSSLTLTKTALTAVYAPGDVIGYVVSITNNGTNDFNDLTLTDDLGAYDFNGGQLYPLTYVDDSAQIFVNGVLQQAPEVTAEDALIIEGIDVPAGGNTMVFYSAQANEFAPPCGGVIRNTASLNNNCPCADAEDFAEIETVCEARLTIAKQLCPSVISSCTEPVRFTFIVRNSGCCPAMANSNIVISDTFTPPINITSVEFNGVEWTEPGYYFYNAQTGQFRTVSGQITVPAATYEQDEETGEWTVTPGESVLVITGTFCAGE